MTTRQACTATALLLAALAFAPQGFGLAPQGFGLAPQAALAQAPAAQSADAAAEAAAKAAFEALPEADRKNIQDALIWIGDYSGLSDGTFGRGTLAAIKAYQTRAKAKADGILSRGLQGTLISDGAKLRQAAGFTVTDDQKSGVRIGVPLRLLDQRAAGKSGTIFKAKDNSASLEVFAEDAASATLADLFQKATTDPAKHVTYKVLRPDFFVVTGDANGKRFFSRVAGTASAIRGFIFVYPPQPALDHVSVAIANSFTPFPDGAAKVADSGKPAAAGPVPQRQLAQLSAIAIGPKQILTAALPAGCSAPVIGGVAAKILRSDAAAGLALLERSGSDAQAPALALRAAEMQPKQGVVVLSTSADGEANVSVAVGEAPSASRILAPLQSPSGSPVFDRSGALAGLVTFQAEVKRLPGGVAPLASYTIVGASAIKSFLAAANEPLKDADQAAADTSSGMVAGKYGRSLLSVTCGS